MLSEEKGGGDSGGRKQEEMSVGMAEVGGWGGNIEEDINKMGILPVRDGVICTGGCRGGVS